MSLNRNGGEPINWVAVIGTLVGVALVVVLILVWFVVFQVRAGEVGVRFDPLGNYPILSQDGLSWEQSSVRPEEYDEGFHLKAPWVKIDKFNVKTQDYTMSSTVEEGQVAGPDAIRAVTSEGLYVDLDITVLYRVDLTKADEIRRYIGRDGEYQNIVVRPTIKSIIREVVSKYEAVDVYGEKRITVESEIQDTLVSNLGPRNIVVERTLLRSVILPPQLVSAIEEKKRAEQEAMRMVFVLEKETLEKERKIIEAGGIAGANAIISGSLTDEYLRWYWINSLDKHNSVIYVPSEGGLPILTRDVDKLK